MKQSRLHSSKSTRASGAPKQLLRRQCRFGGIREIKLEGSKANNDAGFTEEQNFLFLSKVALVTDKANRFVLLRFQKSFTSLRATLKSINTLENVSDWCERSLSRGWAGYPLWCRQFTALRVSTDARDSGVVEGRCYHHRARSDISSRKGEGNSSCRGRHGDVVRVAQAPQIGALGRMF